MAESLATCSARASNKISHIVKKIGRTRINVTAYKGDIL